MLLRFSLINLQLIYFSKDISHNFFASFQFLALNIPFTNKLQICMLKKKKTKLKIKMIQNEAV